MYAMLFVNIAQYDRVCLLDNVQGQSQPRIQAVFCALEDTLVNGCHLDPRFLALLMQPLRMMLDATCYKP